MSDPKDFDYARRVLDAAMTMRLERNRWSKGPPERGQQGSKRMASRLLRKAERLSERVNHSFADDEIDGRAADVANYAMMILYCRGAV